MDGGGVFFIYLYIFNRLTLHMQLSPFPIYQTSIYFITTLTLNFHAKLPLVTETLFYNIGQTSIHQRLKPRLSQDLLHL